MATIKEIAEKAGVSIGTVDRVLHDRGRVSAETKETILRLVKELDYQPNNVVRALAIRRKKLKLDFFTVDPKEHPFFEGVLAGVQAKRAELAQYEVEVDVHTISAYKPSWDLETLQTDGIAMMPTPWQAQVREWAKKEGIPIVYYNIPSEDGLAYVGCDYEKAGRIAAGLCGLMTAGTGKICILSEGDDSIISYRDRVKGFQREAKQAYPQMQIIDNSYTTAQGSDLDHLAEQMLLENPDLDVVYLINPGDYHVCRTIRELSANPNLRIITNDLTDEQRPYMEEGLITATICQEPEKQGAQSLEILFQYLVNGSLPPERNCYTDLSIHIHQNM